MISIVISVGGSILRPKNIDTRYLRNLSRTLKKFSEKKKIFIVTGGGTIAREYIQICRKFGMNEHFLDDIGITATRLNAYLLISALGRDAYPHVPENFHTALLASTTHKFVVMGGTHPGHTTDAVAVMLAEKVNAKRLIILTNVDGVYTRDPNVYPDAKKLRTLTPKKLIEITSENESYAGSHGVIDSLSAKLIARSCIVTYILNGMDLKSVESAFRGKKFNGSIVI